MQKITIENTKPFFLKKLYKAIRYYNRFTMSNWLDLLAEIYQNRKVFLLEKEIDYGFFRGSALTYNDILRFVNRIGNALLKIGIRKGDRIAFITMNRLELALAYFAGMKIGAVVVPLNAMYRSHEIKYVIENCRAKALVTDRQVYQTSIVDTNKFPTIEKWIMLTREEVPPGFYPLSKLMLEAPEELEPIHLNPDDTVALLYTSGTTGYPKGAILHNEAFAREVRRFVLLSALFPRIHKYTGLFVVPLAHVMGYVVMLALISMGILCIFHNTFDPVKTLETIQNYGVNAFIGVPTMYAMLAEAEPEKYDLSSIKVFGSAADALPREYLHRFRKFGGIRLFGKQLIPPLFFEGYGQVETAGITCLLVHPFFFGERELGCVGKPVRKMEVKLVDENWNEVPRGQPGELIVKGPRVTKGYWEAPELNEKSFKDGWFRTGDIMRMDRRGRLYFVDREKDMIKVGGYSVFSKEVEELMLKNPKIWQVAVIGVRDRIKGQKPVAIVTLKPGEHASEEELLQWAKENIAPYKAPRKIIIIDQMPYTSTLKIDKKELRKRFGNTEI